MSGSEQTKRATDALEVSHAMTARSEAGHATTAVEANRAMTAQRDDDRKGSALRRMQAVAPLTAPSDIIDQIRQAYRLAKSAEDTRNRLSSGATAIVRTHYSGWTPGASAAERKETAEAAKKVVKFLLRDRRPKDDGGRAIASFPEVLTGKVEMTSEDKALLRPEVESLILLIVGPWWAFETERHRWRSGAEKLTADLPAWPRMPARGQGFSLWGLVTIIGEAGDIGAYPGCRYLYKRLGLAPDECYPTGEARKGRKIPRHTRGRIMGIIADPLLRQQWRGAKDDEPGHPTGPFGVVYAEAKAWHLSQGKSKGHAEKVARRAMVKALIHDVHNAWHGKPLDYDTNVDDAA